MKKSSFKIEFNTELQYLKKYFKRSTSNPKYSCLEQMIIDRKEELFHPYFENDINYGFKTNKKRTPEALKRLELEEQDSLLKIYQTWLTAIEKHVKTSDNNIVKVIKDVYINEYMNIENASKKILTL